jgi:hypothetical protein
MKHTEGKVKIDVDRIHNGHVDIAVMARYRNFKPINTDEVSANAERIAALWNAADGMTNEEAVEALTEYKSLYDNFGDLIHTAIAVPPKDAVKFVKHGREMVEVLKLARSAQDWGNVARKINATIKKMEG